MSSPKRPNILFIIADDHRHDAIGRFGDPTVQTPRLDRLAGGGVAFRNAHIMGGLTGAVCVPTRACMLTGVSTFRAVSSQDQTDYRGLQTLNPALALMPEQFRQAGYHTYAVGKWHNDKASFARCFAGGAKLFFGGMSDHERVPVHDFDPTGRYPAEAAYSGQHFSSRLFSDAAIQFLDGYDQDDPFFLYLAYTAPHDPRTAPPAYAAGYDPAQIPIPPNFLPEHPFDNGELRVRDEALAPWPRTPAVIQQHLADYYAMISHLDAQLGRVLDTLQQRGLAENTIIVYTADHGLAVGQHGLLGKQNLYDHSVRVPLILSGPGLPADREIAEPVYSFDLFPSLCELTGLPIPDTVESRSLLPLLTGRAESHYDSLFALYRDGQRMVKADGWKLIRYYRSAGGGQDHRQLFNLAADPWETTNLAHDPVQQKRVEALEAALAQWQQRVDDPLRDHQ